MSRRRQPKAFVIFLHPWLLLWGWPIELLMLGVLSGREILRMGRMCYDFFASQPADYRANPKITCNNEYNVSRGSVRTEVKIEIGRIQFQFLLLILVWCVRRRRTQEQRL